MLGIVLAAVYILWRIIQNVFLGTYDPEQDHALDHRRRANMPTARPTWSASRSSRCGRWSSLIFVLGVYPTPLLNYLNGAAVQILNFVQSVL